MPCFLNMSDSCNRWSSFWLQIISFQEFCRLLRTVKVDVDSSGKKCKERMMKVLTESPTSSSGGHGYGWQTDDSVAAGEWSEGSPRAFLSAFLSMSSHQAPGFRRDELQVTPTAGCSLPGNQHDWSLPADTAVTKWLTDTHWPRASAARWTSSRGPIPALLVHVC